jgi:hypothetical protein
MEELQTLDPEFADPEGLMTRAREAVAKEEEEARRQNALAALYAEAVRLLRTGQYQEALEKWYEVQAQDPRYRDRKKVQATAKRKLAALGKRRLPGWVWGLGAAVVITGVVGGLLAAGVVQLPGRQAATPAPAEDLTAIPSGTACVPPPSGLIGWWPGDGDSHELIDGRDGTFHGDATTGPGLVNLAFKLDGDGDFIEVPHDPVLNVGTGDFTVELWVNFDNTSGEQVLVEKWIQGDPFSQGWKGWTFTKLEDNTLRLAIAAGTGDEIVLDSETLVLRPGVWYHIAATRQGTAVTLFMDGESIAQSPDVGALDLDSASSLKFGHRGNYEDTPGAVDSPVLKDLDGRIDEVTLFTGTALSADQIMAIYQAGSEGKCKDAIPSGAAALLPTLGLRVNYGHDWVESFYEAGHTVWITVTESDGVTVKAKAESVTEPKSFLSGEPGFATQPEDWDPSLPDIKPNDWVYASVDNGAGTEVQIGLVKGMIDLEADTVQTTINAPWFSDEAHVECLPWGAPVPQPDTIDGYVLPDGEDTFSCSWAGEWDIQLGQEVGVGYYGPNGHWVADALTAASIVASAEGDWFWTAGFSPQASLKISIHESKDPGAALLWEGSKTANGDGFVHVVRSDHSLDLQLGDYLTVSDGVVK